MGAEPHTGHSPERHAAGWESHGASAPEAALMTGPSTDSSTKSTAAGGMPEASTLGKLFDIPLTLKHHTLNPHYL